jgi:hypothetical protein
MRCALCHKEVVNTTDGDDPFIGKTCSDKLKGKWSVQRREIEEQIKKER